MSLKLLDDAPKWKPRFLSRPWLEPQEDDTSADKRGTWIVRKPLHYLSDVASQRFEVPEGFVNDLASVPKLPFIYLLAGGIGHAAAVVHDWLYTTHQVDRAMADAVFREALGVCNVPGWKAELMFLAVRIAGGSRWDAPGQEQPEGVQKLIASLRPTTEM